MEKNIHQIWFQGEDLIPLKYSENVRLWKEFHKNVSYNIWDETKIDKLIREEYPWFYKTWQELPHMIQKIDSAKLCILHSKGGLYVDMDIKPLRYVWNLIAPYSLVLSQCYVNSMGIGFAKLLGLPNFNKTQINNAVIAAEKGHLVMETALKKMLITSKLSDFKVWGVYIAQTCGPEVLISAMEEVKEEIKQNYKIYPYYFFEPKIGILRGTPRLRKETATVHYCDRTWIKSSKKAKAQLATLVIFIASFVIFIGFKLKKIGKKSQN